MHLNIKNHQAHDLAQELATLTGESLTAAVTKALRAQLAREKRLRSAAEVAAQLMVIGQRYAALPEATAGSPEAILGYDDNGLPT
jgi:antitoxin VapB